MPATAKTIETLIARELAAVENARVVEYVRRMLVEPHVVLLCWDYGEPGHQYPGWMALHDPVSRAEIAYCEHGFGPRCPWGLVGHQEQDRHMGIDSGWFTTFLEAFFDSFASVELPIWRVFRSEANGTRTAMSEEGGCDDAWRRVYELRDGDPTKDYYFHHSIRFGKSIIS